MKYSEWADLGPLLTTSQNINSVGLNDCLLLKQLIMDVRTIKVSQTPQFICPHNPAGSFAKGTLGVNEPPLWFWKRNTATSKTDTPGWSCQKIQLSLRQNLGANDWKGNIITFAHDLAFKAFSLSHNRASREKQNGLFSLYIPLQVEENASVVVAWCRLIFACMLFKILGVFCTSSWKKALWLAGQCRGIH